MLLELIDQVWPAPGRPRSSRYTRGGSLADPPGWLVRLFGGGETAAGVDVSEDTATTISAVFNAVTVLSNPCKVLPFELYRRTGPAAKERAADHPLWRLLHVRPNPEMPASRFWSYLVACKVLWGNAYAEIERDRRGRAMALWPIHPSRVRVERADDGRIVYQIDGGAVTLERPDVLHVPGYSRDGITGISVIGEARESMGLAVAAESYGAQFFGNGGEPGGYLKRPPDAPELDEQGRQNLRSSWYQEHGGKKRHSIAVLEEGTEWVSVGMPNDDAQFLETRKFQVTEVARWFNVPPHKLKDLERATFSNIEHQEIDFLKNSVAPHLVDVQDECNLKLLTADEHEQVFCEFNVAGDLWADHAARAAFYKELWNLGVLSINEIRARENLNPIGPAGDVHFVQLNMTTVEALARTANAPPAAPKPEPSPGERAAAEDLAFKRDVVRAYLQDGTTNDVMFNLTDVRRLLGAVDLPVQPGYEEPWMPVRDDAGELVSGDALKDPQGDIVGGTVLEGTGASAQPAEQPAGAEEEAEEPEGQQPGAQQAEDVDERGDGRGAHGGILPKSAGQQDGHADQGAGQGQGQGPDGDGQERPEGRAADGRTSLAGSAAAADDTRGVLQIGEHGGNGTATPADRQSAQRHRDALRPVFKAIAARLARREEAAMARAREKHAGDRPAFLAWSEKFYGALEEQIHDEFQPAALGLARLLGMTGECLAAGERLGLAARDIARDCQGRSLVAFERGTEREISSFDVLAENVMAAVMGTD